MTSTTSTLEKQDAHKAYMAFMKDPTSYDKVDETQQWLESKVKNKKRIAQIGGAGGPLEGWVN